MKTVSKYDLAHYTAGQLVSCAVIASVWLAFYFVLFSHGLTSSSHGLHTAKLVKANRADQVVHYGSTTTPVDPLE
jgi:hypothetical protein